MTLNGLLLVLADLVLARHVGVVLFVVFGLLLIFVGYFLRWAWVYNLCFRILHLLAISVVVVQSWLGIVCPLTTLEMWLREQGGGDTYSGSFIQHWLQSLLYYQAPAWVFITCYTVFGGLVLTSWFVVKPQRKSIKS